MGSPCSPRCGAAWRPAAGSRRPGAATAAAETALFGLSLRLPPLCMSMPVLTSRYVPSSFSMSALMSFSSSLSPRVPRRPRVLVASLTMSMMLASHARIRDSSDGEEPATTRATDLEVVELLLAAYRRVVADSRRCGALQRPVEGSSDDHRVPFDQSRAPGPRHIHGSPASRL